MSEVSGNIYIEQVQSSFTKISNVFIENENIDPFTLGLYCKVMRLGKRWRLNIKGLAGFLSVSDNKVRTAMKSLENEGFLTRTAVHVDGRLKGWNYTFHVLPVSEGEKTRAGLSENSELSPDEKKYSVRENRQHCIQTTLKTDNTENGEDIIINTENNKRLKEVKELNNNTMSSGRKKPEWKEDYSVYVSIVDDGVSKMMADVEFQKKFEGWYSNVDYVKSVDKTADFWRSVAGWEYAKRKRKDNIDMHMTLRRNIDRNRIYLPIDMGNKIKNKIAAVDEQLEIWRKMRDAED